MAMSDETAYNNAAWLVSCGIDRFREEFGRDPDDLEVAQAGFQIAMEDLRAVRAEVAAAQERLSLLQVQLTRAEQRVGLRRGERDAAGLSALSGGAPALSEVQKKMALLKL